MKKGDINWKYDIGQRIVNENKDVTIVDRKFKKYKQFYKIKCNKCGFDGNKHYKNQQEVEEYWISYDSLVKQKYCPCCGKFISIVVPGINDIPTTDLWMVDYFQGGYEEAKLYHRNSKKILDLKCPFCETIIKNQMLYRFINKNIYKCPACGGKGSYPNRFMYNLLFELNVDFIPEYSPQWVGGRSYDFYIPSLKLVIEMDGGLGHGNKIHTKSTMTIEESIEIDKYKDFQANKYGITVIRINCYPSDFDTIKSNVINSDLINYFNFENIDFLSIDKKALKSKVLQAGELYNNGIHDIQKIADIIGVSRTSAYNYINKCDELGICNYDRKEQQLEKAHVNTGSFQPRAVVCLNTLEIFDTVASAEEKYNIQNISTCCKGEREYAGIDPVTYMPLVWMYYEDYLKMSKKDIEKRLDISIAKGRPIPIICLQTNKIFKSFEQAAKEYNLKSKYLIKKCCEGEKDFYGELEDNTRLQWMYYKNYLKSHQYLPAQPA